MSVDELFLRSIYIHYKVVCSEKYTYLIKPKNNRCNKIILEL